MNQAKITICDGEKVKAAISVLYDYLVFSSYDEIDEDRSRIKAELLQMLKYSSQKELKRIIDSLRYTFKNVPNQVETPRFFEVDTKYYTPELHRASFCLPKFVQDLCK